MNLTEQFREYLKNQGFSANSCKNYVSDLSTFVDYLKSLNQYFSIITLPFVLNTEALQGYKKWLQLHSPISTGNRRLSSLRKFIDFSIENNLTSKDYTGQVTNFTDPNKYLVNTDNDIREAIKFIPNELSDSKEVLQYTNDINNYLTINNNSTTTSRKFCLRQFLSWKKEQRYQQENVVLSSVSQPFKFRPLILTTGAIAIITLLGFFIWQSPDTARQLVNGSSRALQNAVSKWQFPQKESSSLEVSINKQSSFPYLAMDRVLGSQTLIDPLSTSKAKNVSETPLQKIMAYIIQFLFPSPTLVDPVL